MGWGAAVSLLRAGIPTIGIDIRESVTEAFRVEGGIAASSAAAVADCDVVLSFVVNAEQTEQVLFAEGGAVASMASGSVVVSCATVPPDAAVRFAERVGDAGLHYIDAPVSGGATKAREGAMTIMASGSKTAFDKAGPVFDAISTRVFQLGDTAGAASKVKMINQLLAGAHIASACEAMAFGIHNGIDPKTLYEVICECAGSSWMFENRVPHILEGNYAPASAVDIFVKDLGIVTGRAADTDFPTPMADTAMKLFRDASAAGFGGDDDASVVKMYAQKSGIKLPGE